MNIKKILSATMSLALAIGPLLTTNYTTNTCIAFSETNNINCDTSDINDSSLAPSP